MLTFRQKWVKYIIFFILMAFVALTDEAFALEQINFNYESTSTTAATGWGTKNRIATSNNLNTNAQGTTGLRPVYYTYWQLINNSRNTQADGFAYYNAPVTTAKVNASFTWSYNLYRSNNGETGTLTFRYGTSNNNLTDDNILATVNTFSWNQNNYTEASYFVSEIQGNFYTKIYLTATISNNRNRSVAARFNKVMCNISPSGLAGVLAATNNVIDGISLSWNKSTSSVVTFTNYKIYRSNSENGTYTLLTTITNQNTLTYKDTAPLSGDNWYYITDTGSDNTESPASIKVKVTYPKSASDLTGVLTYDGYNMTHTLSWTAADGYSGQYIIRRGTTSGNYTELIYGNLPSANDYNTLTDNTTYYYVVTYSVDGKYAPYSNEYSKYVLYPPTWASPAISYVYDAGTDDDTFVLNWNAKSISGLQSYGVFRSTAESGPYDQIATITAGTTTYTDSDIVAGTTYYYKINCVTTKGESALTAAVSKFFSRPVITNATVNSSKNPVITISGPTPPFSGDSSNVNYVIYRSTSQTGPFTEIAQWVRTNPYTDTSVTLSAGDTYYYYVKEMYNIGFGLQYSGPSNIAAVSAIYPPTISASVLGDYSGIRLTWSYAASQCPEAKLGGYNVYRSTTSGGPYTLIGQTNGSSGVSYTDTTAENAVTYYYVVRTRNLTGAESADSNQVSATINIPVPVAGPTITASLASNKYLPVTINIASNYNPTPVPSAAFGGFNIYRKCETESVFTKIASIASTTFIYNDYTATTGKESEYYVTAFNTAGGESPASNHVKKTPLAIVALTIDNIADISLTSTGTNIGSVDISWNTVLSDPSVAIQSYLIILWKDGVEVGRAVVNDPSATSHSIDNVFFVNNSSYVASVEVTYTVGGQTSSLREYSNSFLVTTPVVMEVNDGWSGKDITYSFFDNRAEANWKFKDDSGAVRYEVALGTTPYGTNVVDWTDVGLVNRIGIDTPELASGTRYYFSVRGFNQRKTQVLSGCSDGFIARKDAVTKDTNAVEFFNNARVLDNLDTAGGQLTPTTAAGSNGYKYCMAVTITEPGVVDRVNAPCLVDFDIPAGKQPANILEFRVMDDQGNIVSRTNLTTPNNSTVAHPYIVFLVNMAKGSTRTYYIYWGNGVNDTDTYGFVNNTGENCLTAWTPYYSRLDTPAGMEDVKMQSTNPSNRRLFSDDVGETIAPLTAMPNTNATVGPITGISRFYFFGTNKTTNWYICSNGYIDTNNILNRSRSESYTNRWEKFTGSSGTILGKCICPLWVDHMCGDSWSASGVFINNAANPNRLIYTWITYRFGVTDDAYKFQAVLYETGDIAIRYGLISPRALFTYGSYDRPVNSSDHTVGISNGDGTRYLYNTPLEIGINQNPTAFYQCMNAFYGNITYGDIIGDGSSYDIAHFQSMVFDTRVAAPKWIGMEYDATVTGARKLLLAYRTGNTPLPDNSWSDWSASTEVTATVTDGNIVFPASVTGRYIQYRADFMKTSNSAGNISLQEVRFIFGGISVETITSFIDDKAVTEVSQGQKDIPVNVTVKNLSPDAVNLASNELNFTLSGHTARLVNPTFPVSIAAQGIATLSYLIDIADNAETGECTIDSYATASSLLYDNGAQIPLTWTVKSKSNLVINSVYSSYTKVTKGFDYDIYVTITNYGEADCVLNELFPTYASGTYVFTLDTSYGLATGTLATGTSYTVIPGQTTKEAKFNVHISTESASGADTIGATASATNKLSGDLISVLGTDNPHIWTIQKPAELNLYNIVASSTLYRGQKNNKITVTATNEGEAELYWYPGSTTTNLVFTPVTNGAKGYENLKMTSGESAIKIDSAIVAQAQYSIDIKQDSATGTDRITATIYGMEENTMTDLEDHSIDDIPSADWTIYAEKVNTYNDGPCNEESDSFNKPSGTNILTVYAKVENLAANTEYMVHWYDSAGTEILTTKPKITAGLGYFIVQLDLDSTCLSGSYKISVTDPLSLYVCCENIFEIVAPAEMTASFTLPLYASVGQPIVASFTYINLGGAEITNATLVPTSTVQINHLDGGTSGDLTLNPDDPTEAVFAPRLSDVPGNGSSTAIFKLIAAQTGRVSMTASASGYDKNSGMALSVPNITSNICTIQNPPNLSVTITNKTSDYIYLNQKNLRVTARITNNGEATAVVTAASITFNIGTYDQELMGYTEPFEVEITSGNYVDLTFDVGVSAESASGLDTITVNAIWYDKNWPVNSVVSGNSTWTIADCGIMLSTDPDFNYQTSDFYRGQTIYIRAFGVNPNTTYYRIRLYTSQIARQTQVPTGYKTGSDQPYSGLVGASDAGYVDHIYTLQTDAANAPIGTWSVTLEGVITSATQGYTTRNNMMALQYFRVQNNPHMVASFTLENVSIENNDKIFVGDTFRGHLTLTSTTADNNTTPAADTGAIDFIEPYSLIKDATSYGTFELVSGPDPATFTLKAGESKTFEYVFKATEYTDTGVLRIKSSDSSYIARGRDRNLWDHDDTTPYDIFAKQQLTSNGIVIYKKTIGISPTIIDFGLLDPMSEDRRFGLVCGALQEKYVSILKTGNYDLDNVSVNKSFLNGPVVSGVKETISDTYFELETDTLSNPLTVASSAVRATLSVPFYKPQGEYTTSMFVYCDSNGNGKFDTDEVTADFDVKVWVNLCKIIKVDDDDKVVDLGSWPKGSTTSVGTVDYFSGGNMDLTNVRIEPVTVSSLTPYITFSEPTQISGAYPLYVGAIPIKQYRHARFTITLPQTAANGIYSAEFRIYEDNDNSGTFNPNPTSSSETSNIESYDTFTVTVTVGEVDFSITPTSLIAAPLETSITAITGVIPGFNRLRITNSSSGGMSLTRIKLTNGELYGTAIDGTHPVMASDSVAIYPGTLENPLLNGESDDFDIEVFVGAGTESATYTTTLQFYSDDNGDGALNGEEKFVNVPLTIYVKPTEKIEVIDKPVSVTGMSSDVQTTYAQVEFLCYNLGNVPLKFLKFETNPLVQKDVTAPVTIPMNPDYFEFPTSPYEAPKKTQFSVKLTIPVPVGTPDGVYITTALCSIYNDDGGDYEHPVSNGGLDKTSECYDEFQVWLQIGEMKIVINMVANNVTGVPSERSTEGSFSVKNDGALTVTGIIATATDLIKAGDTVPATASVFLSSENVGTLKAGMEQSRRWAVDVPDCTPAGVYSGKLIAWSDTNGNKQIDVGEASTTRDVTLTVTAAPKLAIREDSANPVDITKLATPIVTSNSTVSVSVRLYNTGNQNITGRILPTVSSLTNMGSMIDASAISVSVAPFTALSPYNISGQYVLATVTVTLGPTLLNSGHYTGPLEFYVEGSSDVSDSVTLDVEYGIKEMAVNPNPLVFNNLNSVTKDKVTVTKRTSASLKNICAYEKNAPADCGGTTITLETTTPQEVTSSKDFYFQVNLDSSTAAGTYIATWTFFDDDDKDGLWDSTEYYVDFQIHYVVPERIDLTISPTSREVTAAPGDVVVLYYTVTNTGNSALDNNQLVWSLPPAALVDGSGHTLPQSCFARTEVPIAPIPAGGVGTYTITLTIPDTQEEGTYGPANMDLAYNLSSRGVTAITVKVASPGSGVVVPGDTVHQVIDSSAFDNLCATQPYFISAWVCPGLADDPDTTYANLSMVRYNSDGTPKAALSVRINNKTRELEINCGTTASYSVFAGTPYEDITKTSTFDFYSINSQPVYGISGDPVTAKDEKENTLLFYRVYFAFNVDPSDPIASDSIRVLLSESKATETASSTVYFDGVKLEKAFKENQDRPTTFHQTTTLVSPSNAIDMSGKHKYYEW